jgi:non-heme chloroperoxidase
MRWLVCERACGRARRDLSDSSYNPAPADVAAQYGYRERKDRLMLTANMTITSRVTHTHISGGGGVRLHVVETGNTRGRPILFVHGISQSWLAWRRQMYSDLASDYRLVALDLRGHGQSEKPREGYADPLLWADDIRAVARELHMEQPVLCGWSYGPIVILDYVREYGEDDLGGVSFVDGLTKLGSDEALSVVTPEFLSLVPGLFATDAEESVRSLASLLRMCFVEEPSSEDLYLMLGYNVAVPPYVRQGLFSRSFDNDDLLPTIRKPVLVVHGARDAVVKPAIVDQYKASIAHAQIQLMAGAGHAPFWDDAGTFNEHVRRFCEGL